MSGTQTDVPSRTGDGPATPRAALARELRGLGLYFAAAVGIGLVLGALGALLLAPRSGARAAEVAPWALVAAGLGACYLVQRFALKAAPAAGLGGSVAALALVLAVEYIAALRL